MGYEALTDNRCSGGICYLTIAHLLVSTSG
jgi:hypothetical protein